MNNGSVTEAYAQNATRITKQVEMEQKQMRVLGLTMKPAHVLSRPAIGLVEGERCATKVSKRAGAIDRRGRGQAHFRKEHPSMKNMIVLTVAALLTAWVEIPPLLPRLSATVIPNPTTTAQKINTTALLWAGIGTRYFITAARPSEILNKLN